MASKDAKSVGDKKQGSKECAKSDLPPLEETITRSVHYVQIGRKGWISRLNVISADMQAHESEGRKYVYDKLQQALREDLRTYASTKKWPSTWVIACEEIVDEFVETYTCPPLKLVRSLAEVVQKAQKDVIESKRTSEAEIEQRITSAVDDNNAKWFVSVTGFCIMICALKYCYYLATNISH